MALYAACICSYVASGPLRMCDMLQCVAVCCSVLQCVAVCCSVLQCVENVQHRSCACWRILIGCLRSLVSFCQRATNSRALSRKTTCKDKASYDSTPLCACSFSTSPSRRNSHNDSPLPNVLYTPHTMQR